MSELNRFLLEELMKFEEKHMHFWQLTQYGDGVYHTGKTKREEHKAETDCGLLVDFQSEDFYFDWHGKDDNYIATFVTELLPMSDKICTKCLQKIYEKKIDWFEEEFTEQNSLPAYIELGFNNITKPFIKKFINHEGIEGLNKFVNQLIINYMVDKNVDMDKLKDKAH